MEEDMEEEMEQGMEEEKLQIRSEAVQDILERVPTWMIRWGSLLILVLILLLLFLSWLIKYPDVIEAQAIITTEIPPQKEYANVSGKFAEILVKNGALVKTGSPLAVIENTANYKEVFWLKKILDTITIDAKRCYFPIDSIPALQLGSISQPYALFENAYVNYQIYKEFDPLALEASNNKVMTLEGGKKIQALIGQQRLAKKEVAFKKQAVTRIEKLFKKGVVSAQEYENKQLEYLGAKKAYRQLGLRISSLKEGLSTAQKNSKGTQINQTRQEIELSKKVQQQFQNLKSALATWYRNYVLASEIDGNVVFMDIWNANQTLQQGAHVFSIIPSVNGGYIAKLQTPALKSGKIKKGQKVLLKLANFPEEEFGVLIGKITHISAITNKEGMYTIDVALPQLLMTSYQKQLPFSPEMPAAAQIITEDLRLIQRLFYQFRQLWKR